MARASRSCGVYKSTVYTSQKSKNPPKFQRVVHRGSSCRCTCEISSRLVFDKSVSRSHLVSTATPPTICLCPAELLDVEGLPPILPESWGDGEVGARPLPLLALARRGSLALIATRSSSSSSSGGTETVTYKMALTCGQYGMKVEAILPTVRRIPRWTFFFNLLLCCLCVLSLLPLPYYYEAFTPEVWTRPGSVVAY